MTQQSFFSLLASVASQTTAGLHIVRRILSYLEQTSFKTLFHGIIMSIGFSVFAHRLMR